MNRTKYLSIWAMAVGLVLSVQADEIALWNSTGSDPLAGTYAPVSQDSHITAYNLEAGGGLILTGASPAGNTFAAAGYSSADEASALSAGDYWETSFKADTGYSLLFDSIEYRFRRSNTGPPWSKWAYSLDGTSFTWLQPSNAVINDYENDKAVLLSDISALQNVTNRVWFRMVAWGGGTASTSWGAYGKEDVLLFSGTVLSLTGEPVISFSPYQDVQVHVSNTLDVTVSVLPTGSGIQSWSVDPTPAGSTSLTGGTFSFTPTEADDGLDVTLSVVATNAYGASTGTLDIAVTAYAPPGSYEITFDNAGEIKSTWPAATVSLSGRDWVLDQTIIGDTEDDRKIGPRALRFGYLYQATMTASSVLLPDGLGSISFLYAQYGGSDAGAEVVVEVAESATPENWLEVGRVDANDVTELTPYEANIAINEPMYLRLRTEYVSGVGNVNVDSILITPYVAPEYTAYEEFLLEYNVTPGDPGTELSDDLDGDNWDNSDEFSADTNPYDAAIHP